MATAWIGRAFLAAGGCLPLLFTASNDSQVRVTHRSAQPSAPIDRALAYVMENGDAWIKDKKCVSCHMIPGMIWSLTEAKGRGHAVPTERYARWVEWTLDDVVREFPGNEGLAQVIIAKAATPDVSAGRRIYEELAKRLLRRQGADGSWRPGGQTPEQKRPYAEGKEAVTMWAILALHEVLGEKASEAIGRARSSLTSGGQKRSSEWASLRLLVALRLGEPKVADMQLKRLLGSQNPDGGWGWILGEQSDAIATGQNMYALSFVPSDDSRRALARARSFLLNTQREDGSWAVKGTLAQHREHVRPTSVYWGTTWAVIGLTRAQP